MKQCIANANSSCLENGIVKNSVPWQFKMHGKKAVSLLVNMAKFDTIGCKVANGAHKICWESEQKKLPRKQLRHSKLIDLAPEDILIISYNCLIWNYNNLQRVISGLTYPSTHSMQYAIAAIAAILY